MTAKRHPKEIARELPPVGTTLEGRFKGETRTAAIIEAHAGTSILGATQPERPTCGPGKR